MKVAGLFYSATCAAAHGVLLGIKAPHQKNWYFWWGYSLGGLVVPVDMNLGDSYAGAGSFGIGEIRASN